MKFVGSKNKLAKHLAPIIQSYITEDTHAYFEPFVGGANMIDKIDHWNKIGYDIHKELIALLNYAQTTLGDFPEGITKEEYIKVRDNEANYPKWYVGLVGFCASYNAKYFGGYAGECHTKDGVRHYDREAIRNLKKQSVRFKNITFKRMNFLDVDISSMINCVIYCDIPYKNTTKYKTEPFPYDKFYEWCKKLSVNNTVLISEYNMPKEFDCIWEKPHKTSLDKNDNSKDRIEKLFIYKGDV